MRPVTVPTDSPVVKKGVCTSISGALTRSPSDGKDVRWYFGKTPLKPNAVAASMPPVEVVPKGEFLRFSKRDSLALEAAFERREEELLTAWWKEVADCSMGPTIGIGAPASATSAIRHSGSSAGLAMQDDRGWSLEDGRLREDRDDIGVIVKGGLYEVDLLRRRCFAVYWGGEDRRVLRGHWFARKGGADWLPLREDVSEQLEIAYGSQVWRRKAFQPSKLYAARVELAAPTQGLHALFTGESDTWEAWLCVDDLSTKLSTILGLGGRIPPGYKLRRGFAPPDNPQASQEEHRQQREEELDDYCTQVPVKHLVFMVHGIGQRLEAANVVADVSNFRQTAAALAEQHLTLHQRNYQRVLFIPCQWRKSLVLGGEEMVKAITIEGVKALRQIINATVHDVLYYMSSVYCQDIIDSVTSSLNSLYRKFIRRNPDFDGKVSIYGHSLGSVLTYDILCHQDIPELPPEMVSTRWKRDEMQKGESSMPVETCRAADGVQFRVGNRNGRTVSGGESAEPIGNSKKATRGISVQEIDKSARLRGEMVSTIKEEEEEGDSRLAEVRENTSSLMEEVPVGTRAATDFQSVRLTEGAAEIDRIQSEIASLKAKLAALSKEREQIEQCSGLHELESQETEVREDASGNEDGGRVVEDTGRLGGDNDATEASVSKGVQPIAEVLQENDEAAKETADVAHEGIARDEKSQSSSGEGVSCRDVEIEHLACQEEVQSVCGGFENREGDDATEASEGQTIPGRDSQSSDHFQSVSDARAEGQLKEEEEQKAHGQLQGQVQGEMQEDAGEARPYEDPLPSARASWLEGGVNSGDWSTGEHESETLVCRESIADVAQVEDSGPGVQDGRDAGGQVSGCVGDMGLKHGEEGADDHGQISGMDREDSDLDTDSSESGKALERRQPNMFFNGRIDKHPLRTRTLRPKRQHAPRVAYSKLDFEVDTFFAVGSPLGLFLALRNIRLGTGHAPAGLWPDGIKEEMPKLQCLVNIFHPYDPVAYRIEPLISREYVKRRPVHVPYHKGGKRIHIGMQEFGENLAFKSAAVGHKVWGSMTKMGAKAYGALVTETVTQPQKEEIEPAHSEKMEVDDYSAQVMERLTGSRDGRIDFMLQDATFEHQYIAAISSHTSYWGDHDTALFIVRHLYRNIKSEDGDVSASKGKLADRQPSKKNSKTEDIDGQQASSSASPSAEGGKSRRFPSASTSQMEKVVGSRVPSTDEIKVDGSSDGIEAEPSLENKDKEDEDRSSSIRVPSIDLSTVEFSASSQQEIASVLAAAAAACSTPTTQPKVQKEEQ